MESPSQQTADAQASDSVPASTLITMIWAIALAGFILGAGSNIFLFQQYLSLKAQQEEQAKTLENLEKIQLGLRPMLQDIINSNPTNTDLLGLFPKYGIQVLPPITGTLPMLPPPANSVKSVP